MTFLVRLLDMLAVEAVWVIQQPGEPQIVEEVLADMATKVRGVTVRIIPVGEAEAAVILMETAAPAVPAS